MSVRSHHLLGAGLFALGTFVIAYAVLGPLVLDVIHFRTSASGLNQVRGGDLAALVVVAPVCVAVGVLAWRGHPAAPVLALAPAIFAMYTYSQLVLANEYLRLPGNIEMFFPLLLVMFWLAAAITVRSVGLVASVALPPWSRRLEAGTGVLLLAIAAFVLFGLHLPTLLDAMSPHPSAAAYLDTPTAFWVVKFYDLGIVVPAATVVGVGLLGSRRWARTSAYAIVCGYLLIGWSVEGMAVSMTLDGDPDASVGLVAGFTALAATLSTFAWFLYRPLLLTGPGPPYDRSHRSRDKRPQAPVRTLTTQHPAENRRQSTV